MACELRQKCAVKTFSNGTPKFLWTLETGDVLEETNYRDTRSASFKSPGLLRSVSLFRGNEYTPWGISA